MSLPVKQLHCVFFVPCDWFSALVSFELMLHLWNVSESGLLLEDCAVFDGAHKLNCSLAQCQRDLQLLNRFGDVDTDDVATVR